MRKRKLPFCLWCGDDLIYPQKKYCDEQCRADYRADIAAEKAGGKVKCLRCGQPKRRRFETRHGDLVCDHCMAVDAYEGAQRLARIIHGMRLAGETLAEAA